MELKIEYVKINELKEYEKNAKLHPADQVEQIKKSIQQFGMNDPIAVWKDNVIIEGHGRLIACRELGLTELPVIRLDSLTDEQRRAYTLAHNKLTMNSGFDIDILADELDSITDIDMSDFGFDDIVIPDFDEQEIIEDKAPDSPDVIISKAGDIWLLGNHRLICGDSTKVSTLEKLMVGVKADMVFTDPPYGYKYQSNMRTESPKFDVLKNDDKILDFFPLLSERVNGFVMICTTWKVLDKWLPLFNKYFELSNMIIWDKGGGGIGDLMHTFATDYEVILCSNNKHKIEGKRIGSVWDIGKDKAVDYIHPTQKPVELSAQAIKHTTKKGDIVLDLFGGSGSTLIASEQTKRKCYMVELDVKYVDVIVQRYINFKDSDADIFLIRDGKKIPYAEIKKEE